jgi:glyoxylase-like metal-dependent hydrolase (beta-lactamase superfamily II)
MRRTSFFPASDLKKLSENLYLLEDTCNVYLVRDGSRGLLIDFGSGTILKYLSGLGISKVDWVLHTHHHRDQCQGDYQAVERSIPIAVPAHERHLFADAENFWRNRRVFHLYYVRNDFNTMTENIPVASLLHDYGTFRWGNRDIFVLPTPGHTLGSVSLVMEVDGKRTAFTGDLMHSPESRVHFKRIALGSVQCGLGGILYFLLDWASHPSPEPQPVFRLHCPMKDGLLGHHFKSSSRRLAGLSCLFSINTTSLQSPQQRSSF